MKVFISGPMSGKPYYNRAAFYKAQEELEKHGYSVWNPAWLAYPNDTEFTKDDMHIIDFAAIRLCDAIYMLKGWKYSKGAQEERDYAEMRGLVIMYEGACCWGKEPVFDQEFAYDKAIKNRTNYQLEAIKGNIRAKYAELKEITENLDIGLGNESDRINSLEGEVEAIKESIGTDNLQEQLEKDFADVYEEFQNTKDQVNDINMGYIKWSSEVSQFDERIEKLENTVKGLNSIVATLGERNGVLSDKLDNYKEAYMHLDNADEALERRITALEMKLSSFVEGYNSTLDRMNLFSRELDCLSTAIDNQGKDIRQIMQGRHYDNKGVNNTLTELNIRLKAIEKRLNIKPFYAPTEDEKDD